MKIKVFKIRLDDEFLESDQENVNAYLEQVTLKKSSVRFVDDKNPYWSVIAHYLDELQEEPHEPETEVLNQPAKSVNEIKTKSITLEDFEFTEKELQMVEYIKQWRHEKSKDEVLPAYMILSNNDIYSLVNCNPTNFAQMRKIRGFGDRKVSKYGDDILSILLQFESDTAKTSNEGSRA